MSEMLVVELSQDEYREMLRLADFNVAAAQSNFSRVLDEGHPVERVEEAQRSYDASMSLFRRLREIELRNR
jgi:hypothetical protein